MENISSLKGCRGVYVFVYKNTDVHNNELNTV